MTSQVAVLFAGKLSSHVNVVLMVQYHGDIMSASWMTLLSKRAVCKQHG